MCAAFSSMPNFGAGALNFEFLGLQYPLPSVSFHLSRGPRVPGSASPGVRESRVRESWGPRVRGPRVPGPRVPGCLSCTISDIFLLHNLAVECRKSIGAIAACYDITMHDVAGSRFPFFNEAPALAVLVVARTAALFTPRCQGRLQTRFVFFPS